MSRRMDPEVASRIALVVFDADGVLTDGGIGVGRDADGGAVRLLQFHVRDGLALHMLREAGIEACIVSGREDPALRERTRELGLDEIHQVSPHRKVAVVARMLEARGLDWDRVACLADDLADLALMERVALPCAVADAVEEVGAAARWRGGVRGGQGAVREFVECLLEARGEWDIQVERYVERGREGA